MGSGQIETLGGNPSELLQNPVITSIITFHPLHFICLTRLKTPAVTGAGLTIESEWTVFDSFFFHISSFLIQKVNTDKVVAQANMKTSQITMFVKTFHILLFAVT